MTAFATMAAAASPNLVISPTDSLDLEASTGNSDWRPQRADGLSRTYFSNLKAPEHVVMP